MEAIVADLGAQHAELAGVLGGLAIGDWAAPTRCMGWDVADVVLHLAQTDEMALASATGSYAAFIADAAGDMVATASVDEAAAVMVARRRGEPVAALRARWATGAARLRQVLRALDPSTRVPWVAGDLAARTLATTRLAETWIHTGDVADAVGVALAPTDRIRPIARLAWRTLPYAFRTAGLALHGPVAFRLTSPAGERWDFVPEGDVATTITGPAVELCAVAARRAEPSTTSLAGEGPDAAAVLSLVRTYA